MDVKIDPKFVMDLFIFKVDGTNYSPAIKSHWKSSPWLLVGIPSGDPFLATHYMEKRSESSDQHKKKLMSLREGLRAVIQCYRREHSAHYYRLHEHPGGPASWREPMMRTLAKESTTYYVRGPMCKWNIQKMRAESSEYVRKTTGFFTNRWRIKIALESYFVEHAQEVWERN